MLKLINYDINSVNKKDVYNSLKALSSNNIQSIKCGQYTFKLEDYLKIPLIKNDGLSKIIKSQGKRISSLEKKENKELKKQKIKEFF